MGKDITFFVSKIPYSSKRIIDLNCTIVPFSKKVLSFLVKIYHLGSNDWHSIA